jgi:hypothetical protein
LLDAAFAPEDIQRITSAYEAALQKLGLVDRGDPVTEVVAQKKNRGGAVWRADRTFERRLIDNIGS